METRLTLKTLALGLAGLGTALLPAAAYSLTDPIHVDVSGEKNIVVLDKVGQVENIVRLASDGSRQAAWPLPDGRLSVDFCLDPAGQILVLALDGRQQVEIQAWDPQGELTGLILGLPREAGQGREVLAIAASSDRLFILAQGRQGAEVIALTREGRFAGKWSGTGAGRLNAPTSLSTDSQGNLYVADRQSQGQGIIIKYAPDGRVLATLFGGADVALSDPQALKVIAGGELAVSDLRPDGSLKVFSFDAHGNCLNCRPEELLWAQVQINGVPELDGDTLNLFVADSSSTGWSCGVAH